MISKTGKLTALVAGYSSLYSEFIWVKKIVRTIQHYAGITSIKRVEVRKESLRQEEVVGFYSRKHGCKA